MKKNEDVEVIYKQFRELVQVFTQVNSERLALRKILKELLMKKFWQVKKEHNHQLFYDQMEGIKKEITLKRIEKLEDILEEHKAQSTSKNKQIDSLTFERDNLKTLLNTKKQEIKNFILKDENYNTNR